MLKPSNKKWQIPDDNDSPTTDNRAGEQRWQAERRAAMETIVLYWNAKQQQKSTAANNFDSTNSGEESSGDDDSGVDVPDMIINDNKPIKGNIIWAGLEPLEFKAIFPEWVDRDDIAQINIQVN